MQELLGNLQSSAVGRKDTVSQVHSSSLVRNTTLCKASGCPERFLDQHWPCCPWLICVGYTQQLLILSIFNSQCWDGCHLFYIMELSLGLLTPHTASSLYGLCPPDGRLAVELEWTFLHVCFIREFWLSCLLIWYSLLCNFYVILLLLYIYIVMINFIHGGCSNQWMKLLEKHEKKVLW